MPTGRKRGEMAELNEKEKMFLIGLEKLTRETGIQIGGCGCCGSPFLYEDNITSEKSGYGIGYADNIAWIDPSDEDDWENFNKSIVKA